MMVTTTTKGKTFKFWHNKSVAAFKYGSGHETAAVLLPGFAINW